MTQDAFSEEPLPVAAPLSDVDAVVPLPAGTSPSPDRLAALHARAAQIAPPLARAIRWLRWPSLLVLVVALLAPVLLGALALTWQGWPRVVGVVVALLALVPAVLLGRSRAGTLRAAENPDALVAELVVFTSHVQGGLGILDKLAAVTQRGGVRLLARLKAVWDVLQIPNETLEHLDSQTHLRWVLPPRVGETWARLLATVWTTVGCYVAAAVLGAVSLTGAL